MEFSSFVITNKGQALMAKLMQGTGFCTFTNIKLSSTTYSESQIPALIALGGVKQTTPITRKTVLNTTSIMIEGALDNTELTTGYNIQTIGIFANDPDEGEILYAVARATTPGYMPPYNGITVSGATFKFVITVGNANNVTITLDPAGYASLADVQELHTEIANLKGFVGYSEDDVYGVEVDFVNKTFTRLAGAVGRNSGAGFDPINAFGGRYRCNLTDDGVEVAKYGEAAYSETGKLLTAVTIGKVVNAEGAVTNEGTTYSAGTLVQTMVKQPRFYYKVVPLVTEKVEGGKGYHMRKARYYVSDTPKTGFKLHPAFIHNGAEKDYVYLSAYEGTLYDASAPAYILDDAQVADFATDKLCSIANAKPISGVTQNLTRRNCGKLAENRGAGWYQSYAALVSASQLLFLIEYASFNTQSKIGNGNVSKPWSEDSVNYSENTGATATLGNASGNVSNANGVQIVTYRGEENLWGNIWKFIDGLNIYAYGKNELYVADHGFTESTTADPYKNAGITLAKTNGYVSAMAYNEEFDWLFFPSEVNSNGANSSVPVGDYFYQNHTYQGFLVALLGAGWNGGAGAGAFFWDVYDAPGGRLRNFGGRLAYVPGVTT